MPPICNCFSHSIDRKKMSPNWISLIPPIQSLVPPAPLPPTPPFQPCLYHATPVKSSAAWLTSNAPVVSRVQVPCRAHRVRRSFTGRTTSSRHSTSKHRQCSSSLELVAALCQDPVLAALHQEQDQVSTETAVHPAAMDPSTSQEETGEYESVQFFWGHQMQFQKSSFFIYETLLTFFTRLCSTSSLRQCHNLNIDKFTFFGSLKEDSEAIVLDKMPTGIQYDSDYRQVMQFYHCQLVEALFLLQTT